MSSHWCDDSSNCSTVCAAWKRQEKSSRPWCSTKVVPHPKCRCISNFFDWRMQLNTEIFKRVLRISVVLEVNTCCKWWVSCLTLKKCLFLSLLLYKTTDINFCLNSWESVLKGALNSSRGVAHAATPNEVQINYTEFNLNFFDWKLGQRLLDDSVHANRRGTVEIKSATVATL